MVKKLLGAAVLLASLCTPQLAFAQANSAETPGHQPKLTKLPKLVHFEEAPYPESEKAAGKTAAKPKAEKAAPKAKARKAS